MVEMSTEIGRIRCSIDSMAASVNGEDVFIKEKEISSGAVVSTWLLGLNLNEFGSRMRHSVHVPGEMPHVHVHASPNDPPHLHVHKPPTTEAPKRNHTQDLYVLESENQIYSGFLIFAVAYASTSALLIFGSIAEIRWTTVPWLLAHLGTVSAQTAGLIVQVTAATSTVPENDHLAPGHPDDAHCNEDDQEGSSAPGALILSALNMCFLVYVWVVVIVAMRSWRKKTTLIMSTRAAPGDESFVLSSLGSPGYTSSYC